MALPESIPVPLRVAVLLTCHNRREKTLRCLRSLFSQDLPPETSFVVYMVDDASSDGTPEAVAREFPQIRILQGSGALYWCGGMRLAWVEAMKCSYDGYLWLNDDVELVPGALSVMLKTWGERQGEAKAKPIVVGACHDPRSNRLVYGGYPWDIAEGHLPESNRSQRCYTMNGNIVLVPQEVAASVGNLSPDYTHAMGDIDYGLRASKKGFAIYVAPGILGRCESHGGFKWTRSDVPFLERWRDLHSPKGLPPWQYTKLRRQCGLPFWFLVPVKIYLRVCFPWVWESRQRTVPRLRNRKASK